MKVVILAGGRGERLGALTKKLQKAVLSFKGIPLIHYALNSLMSIKEIKEVFVLTGYRGEDVRRIVLAGFSKERIKLLDFPLVRGNLSRLAAAFNQIDITEGCFLCGVDSLVSAGVAKRFWLFSCQNRSRPLLLLSPRLGVAITHSLVVFREGLVVSYRSFKKSRQVRDFGPDCYVDTGIRYFPESFCQLIKKEGRIDKQYIPHFVEKVVQGGQQVGGLIFVEPWRHFSVARDFFRR